MVGTLAQLDGLKIFKHEILFLNLVLENNVIIVMLFHEKLIKMDLSYLSTLL